MTDDGLVEKKLAIQAVRDVVENRLPDLLAFAAAIRGRLGA